MVAVVGEQVVCRRGEAGARRAQEGEQLRLALARRAKVEHLARFHRHRRASGCHADAAAEEVLEPPATPVDHDASVRYDVHLLADHGLRHDAREAVAQVIHGHLDACHR